MNVANGWMGECQSQFRVWVEYKIAKNIRNSTKEEMPFFNLFELSLQIENFKYKLAILR